MLLVLIALLPFACAAVLFMMSGAGKTLQTLIAITPSFLGLLLLSVMLPPIIAGGVVQFHMPWVPLLGLEFSLWLDGFALLFAALILGIGLLIILYARFYLPADEAMGRFMALMLLFQGAMLGIALSSNILLLLIFWELTSLSSFLLIGFRSDKTEGRQGARMALTVTGGGGLALIGGLCCSGTSSGLSNWPTFCGPAKRFALPPFILSHWC